MLDDRIIVQDRTADYGLAALLQNTNKNMDPYACMAMMNNNGWGNNGMWWIWMILLWAIWGGNGFGNGFGRGNGAGFLANQLNNDTNTTMLLRYRLLMVIRLLLTHCLLLYIVMLISCSLLLL